MFLSFSEKTKTIGKMIGSWLVAAVGVVATILFMWCAAALGIPM